MPPLATLTDEPRLAEVHPTLVEQAEGIGSLRPATDAEAVQTGWRLTLPYLADAVALYEAGESLNKISQKLGIAWDSVARLLDRAGVRERKNKSR